MKETEQPVLFWRHFSAANWMRTGSQELPQGQQILNETIRCHESFSLYTLIY
jgi:hypothetical protein